METRPAGPTLSGLSLKEAALSSFQRLLRHRAQW
jgi:hypothetical protein